MKAPDVVLKRNRRQVGQMFQDPNEELRHKAFVALGSNIGSSDEKLSVLRRAVARLESSAAVRVEAASRVYRSPPWGVTNQPDFLNAVVAVATSLSALELLDLLKGTETALGRQERFRWGPREIDLDLLLYDTLQMRQGALELPHPRMLERSFVVVPLLEIAPGAVLPSGRRVCEAVEEQVLHDPALIPEFSLRE